MESKGRRGVRAVGPTKRPMSPPPPASAAPFPVQKPGEGGFARDEAPRPEPKAAAPIEEPAADGIGAGMATSTESPLTLPTEQSPPTRPMEGVSRPPVSPSAPVVQSISPPIPTPMPIAIDSLQPAAASRQETGAIMTDAQTALRRGFEKLSEEVAAYVCRSIDNAARSSVDLLGIRTWSDALAVNSKFTQACFDLWIDSSAKISELGIKLAIESSRSFHRN